MAPVRLFAAAGWLAQGQRATLRRYHHKWIVELCLVWRLARATPRFDALFCLHPWHARPLVQQGLSGEDALQEHLLAVGGASRLGRRSRRDVHLRGGAPTRGPIVQALSRPRIRRRLWNARCRRRSGDTAPSVLRPYSARARSSAGAISQPHPREEGRRPADRRFRALSARASRFRSRHRRARSEQTEAEARGDGRAPRRRRSHSLARYAERRSQMGSVSRRRFFLSCLLIRRISVSSSPRRWRSASRCEFAVVEAAAALAEDCRSGAVEADQRGDDQ